MKWWQGWINAWRFYRYMKLSCYFNQHITVDGECVCQKMTLPVWSSPMTEKEWAKFKDGAGFTE